MTYKDIVAVILTEATGLSHDDIIRLLDRYDDTYQGDNRLLTDVSEAKAKRILSTWKSWKAHRWKGFACVQEAVHGVADRC